MMEFLWFLAGAITGPLIVVFIMLGLPILMLIAWFAVKDAFAGVRRNHDNRRQLHDNPTKPHNAP